jgi:hypothetical protein
MKLELEALCEECSQHRAQSRDIRWRTGFSDNIESIRTQATRDLEILDAICPTNARLERDVTHGEPVGRCLDTFTPTALTVATLKLARPNGSDIEGLRKAEMEEPSGKYE